MAKKETEFHHRARLRVKSYDAKLIDNSVRQIIEAIRRQGGEVVGPVPLPTEFKKWTVNRSTFVHKKSREAFELRVHKRLVDIVNLTPEMRQALDNLTLPSGVDIEMKV